MRRNKHQEVMDEIINTIIKNKEYQDAVMCYYCIELTANQKERLELIIIAAALMGITLNKLLEKKND